LRATAHGVIRQSEESELAQCSTCRGVGWYVTADNRKQMCRHGKTAASRD
jgi:hypothetical protein